MNYVLLLLLVFLNACTPLEMGGGPISSNTSSTNNTQGVSSPSGNNALTILQQNCTACHGSTSGSAGVYGLQSVDHMIQAGLIVPGFPDQSPLYNEIASGSMPPSGPLSMEDQNTIQQWITSSANPSPVVKPSPTPVQTPSPSPAPPVNMATFTYIQQDILTPKCTGCHSGSGGSAGYRFDTYAGTMKAVNIKNPTLSKLYTITHSGQMPPSSSKRLNSEQENLILQWIENGAANN